MTNSPTAASDLKKALRTLRAVFAAFTLALAALVAVVWDDSRTRSEDLEALLERQEADRLQGQMTSCHRYNEDLARSINKLVTENIEFVAFLGQDFTPETPRTQEQQAAVAAAVAERQAEFRSAELLYRDCSPEGVEAYSEGDGGFLPGGPPP